MLGPDENVLSKALEHWGADLQRTVAIEELSELTKELCKDARGIGKRDNIIEEMADVIVVLTTLQLIYDVADTELESNIQIKMKRLTDILKRLKVL